LRVARDKLSSTVVIVPGAAVELGMTDEPLGDARLRQTLKRRHMTMIALGGVIGAGLFVGSRGGDPVRRSRGQHFRPADRSAGRAGDADAGRAGRSAAGGRVVPPNEGAGREPARLRRRRGLANL
jgi:hypothetical protein